MTRIQDFSLFLGDLTGSWALDLKGTQIMHFDLQIYQEGDPRFGNGPVVRRAKRPGRECDRFCGRGQANYIHLLD